MKNCTVRTLLSIALCFTLVFALAACQSPSADNSQPADGTDVPATGTPSTPEPPSFSEYTIRFDLNTTADPSDNELYVYEESGYDENWQPVTQEKEAVFTVPAGDDAYLDVTVPDPTREGYYFAGWQTRPTVTETDLVNGVSPYLWMTGQKLSAVGQVQLANSSAEEISARMLDNETMALSGLESLDENGNGTLYARWVEVKQISNEEELQAMANDLYGAYELTADIQLTQPWTPVGCYFQNYEYFETNWWTFAFRGTLLGNGYTISGLTVNGASVPSDEYRTNDTASVWHNDGVTCNGTAAMFSATAGANIQNLILSGTVIDVTGENAADGEYCYAAALTAFDIGSTLTGVSVENADIEVNTTEANAQYRDSLYTSVAGLAAGGWNTIIRDCSVSGNVSLNAETAKSHGGAIYLGGMVGECYADMSNCSTSDLTLTLNSEDLSDAADDTALAVSVGGLNGTNTSTTGNTVDAAINISVSKPTGASIVNVGGYTGSQLYMTAAENTVNAVITTDCELDEDAGILNVGNVAGRIDVYYMLQILQYTPVANSGATGNTASVTCNGQPVESIIAGLPELDGQPVGWINNGEYEITEGYTAPSNIEAIIEAYGSYVPQSSMMPGIVWITVE